MITRVAAFSVMLRFKGVPIPLNTIMGGGEMRPTWLVRQANPSHHKSKRTRTNQNAGRTIEHQRNWHFPETSLFFSLLLFSVLLTNYYYEVLMSMS